MKKVKKVLSAVLVSALLMQSVAVPVSAAEDPFEAAAPTAGESIRPENAPEGSEDNLQVLYEVEEQREAAVKHFRLSDGSYVAASYPTAVHYAVGEDEWKEIDNTLNLVSSGESSSERSVFSKGQVYQAVNGENEKSYAAVLEPDEELLSLQNSDFGLHMAILSSETAEDLLETAEPVPTPTPAPEEPSSSENTQEPEESEPPVESSDESSEEASEPSASSEVSSEPDSLAVSSMETELGEVYAGEFSENGETTELEGEEVSDVIPEETAGPGDSSEESSIPDASESSDVGESESSPLPSESEPESSVVESEPEPTPLPTPDPTEEPSGGSSMASVPAKVENPDEAESPEPPGGEGDMPGEEPGPGPGDEPVEPVESVEEQVQPDKISSKVTYENVLPGVDLVYQNYGFNVKESIVIKSQQDMYRYSFLLNFDGLTPVLEPNGGVSLKNSQDEVIYQIPAPYMVDANQAVSYDASYELAFTEQGYVLTVTADETWMDSAERAYPISIDPTFILYGGDYQGSITATSLTEGSSVTGAGGESIYIGTDYAGREMQAFLQFGTLPTLPSNCTVAAAVLGMFHHTYSAVDMNRLFVRAHEVTEDKPDEYETAAQWVRNMTWNTRPSFDTETSEAYARLVNGNTGGYVEWDISRIVSKWYEQNEEDRVLAMDAIGPEAFTSSKYATSVFWMNVNYTPIFLIYYRNNVGIENRMTYQTASVERAGTAYVGDYTEQLTVELPLLSSNSDVLPFALSAYYNSPYRGRYFTRNDGVGIHTADYTNMYVGSGWKLSVQETIMQTTVETENESTDYYVYTDADGTEHYFEADSAAPYEDEEGLGYSLSISGSTYTLEDESENKKEFVNGYLTRLIDNKGNVIYYLYNDTTNYSSSNPFSPSGTTWKPKADQPNRVTQIWQINDNGSTADVQSLICKLHYSGDFLSSVTDKAGRTYTFTYESPSSGARLLSEITFPDGHSAQYDYSAGAHLLTKMYDEEAEYGYEFAYQTVHGNYCVESGKEFVASSIDGAQSVGNSWNVWIPSLQQRLYRFYGQDRVRNTEDDVLVNYTFDLAGRTVNIINYSTDRTEILGTSAASYSQNEGTSKKNNKVTGASSSGVSSANLLLNSGMEVDSANRYGWNIGSQVSGAGIAFRNDVSEVSPTITPRTGDYLLKIYTPAENISTSGSGGKISVYQEVYLEAGNTYVFSGYANSSGMETFGRNGGVNLSFQDGGGDILAESGLLDYATSDEVEGGWSRLEVTFTPDTSGTYRVAANVNNSGRYTAFDDFQLEEVVIPASDMPDDKKGTATSVNLLQMGNLEQWTSSGASSTDLSKYWTYNTGRVDPVLATGDDASRGYVFQLRGHPDAGRRASQTININRSSNTTYMVSAWAKALSVTDCAAPADMEGDNSNFERFFGMIVEIEYSDSTAPEYQYVSFDPSYDGWQYASGFIVPEQAGKTVSSITLSLAYDHNVNIALFDQVSLTEEPAQTYTYDDEGKLVAVTTSSQSTDTYDYTGPDLTQFVSARAGQFDFTYDSSHNMTKATNDGVNLTSQYDAAGNKTQTKLQKGTSGIYLQESATYTADGNHVATADDVNNITTSYTYESLGRLGSTTTPTEEGNLTVNQTYVDGTNSRVNSTYSAGLLSLPNTYEQGVLTGASRKTFVGSTPQWQRYTMPIDTWRNITAVQVASGNNVDAEEDVAWSDPITLASYEYEPDGGPMTRMEYGNGDSEDYYYDLYGRLSSVSHSSNLLEYVESYSYDTFGNVSRSVVEDGSGNLLADYQYEYDSIGRLIRSRQSGEGVTGLFTQHDYDDQNRLKDQYWQVSDESLHESYSYNNNNGTLSSMLLGTGRTLSFVYDDLLRVSRRNVSGVYQHRRNYMGTGTANRQTNRIQYYVYASADGADTKMTYRYDYDSAGNINEVYRQITTGSLDFLSSYEYDKLGQLTEATDSRGTETFTYDTAGNILSRTLAGDMVTYSYDNNQWNDLLTAYDGQKIAYEGQSYSSGSNSVSGTVVSGNPVSYYNGTRWEMAWANGSQLAEASSNTADVSYTYDSAGLRATKTVDGTTYHYAYTGDKLVWQEWDGNELFFFYDNEGSPIGFWYHPATGSNVTGYYMTTQQGDITRIEDVNGNVLATYEYDAWGKLISSSGTLAEINPLRYRGYYYDVETGFYYLQSRYYDPVVSRFINADTYASTGDGLLGYNMFAYCGNNPVCYSDPTGHFALVDDLLVLLGLAVVTAVTAIVTAVALPVIQEGWNNSVESFSAKPKTDYQEKAKEQVIPKQRDQTIYIYRYGGKNPGNLTPKKKDVTTGLSFSTIPKPGAARTTIEELNATGLVYAVQDKPNHVGVWPVGGTMQDWIDAGPNSKWTQAVKSVVITWKG